MKTVFLVVGRTVNPHLQALIDDYSKRLTHYLPFSLEVLPDLKQTKNLTEEQQKQAEGQMIIQRVAPSADLILLDERGEEMRSIEFARYMQKKQTAARDLVFVCGGPYGFSEDVYKRAGSMISLSRMTFSHQMVRLFFVEQLYRAMTILRGEPYHHE